jgi:hypothetical protein
VAKLRLLHGPLLLLLYQTAPVTVERDSLGLYRLTLGYAAGQWQDEDFSCDGQLINATPVAFQSVGGQLDVWPDRSVRVTGFAGATRDRHADTPDPSAVTGWTGFHGIQFAYEGRSVGAGLGLAETATLDGGLAPSLYLRFGDIDRVHFRTDMMPPSAMFPTAGWGRIGAGYNAGHLRRAGGFLGIGVGPADYSEKVVFFGELRLPVGRHLTSQFNGLIGPGARDAQFGGGVALRLDF